jgi:hypothetical protein
VNRATLFSVVLVSQLAWLSESLLADSYRCGRKLVRTGDSRQALLSLCGQPEYKDRGQQEVKVDGRRVRVSVERWYYRKNKRSLQRMVALHKGRVVSIQIRRR